MTPKEPCSVLRFALRPLIVVTFCVTLTVPADSLSDGIYPMIPFESRGISLKDV